jgi:hypothetical protein
MKNAHPVQHQDQIVDTVMVQVPIHQLVMGVLMAIKKMTKMVIALLNAQMELFGNSIDA